MARYARNQLVLAVGSATLFSTLATLPAAAIAQQLALEEVVVTAQKREESLQDTPISISALSRDALEKIRFMDITDLTGEIPNLQIRSTAGDSNGATIAIRGTVTTNPNINFEPTVGIYLDGVFIAKNTGNLLDFVDLERIEVLRGPQGTLYGKNTIGGAINLVTQKPTGEFGLNAKFGVGRFDERFGKVTVNFPAIGSIGEGPGQLSSKITYRKYQRDGWADNVFSTISPFAEAPSSRTFGEKDDEAVRLSLLWDINNQWSARYEYDRSEMDRTPPLMQLTRITPNGLFDPEGFLCSPTPIQGACFSNTQLHNYAESERLSTASNNDGGREELKITGHALTLEGGSFEWGAMGDVSLRSITARRTTDSLNLLDLDGTNVGITGFLRDIDYEQLSQEFQLIGSTDRVNYVLGLFYFEEEAFVNNPGVNFGYFEQFGATINPVITQFGFDNDALAVYGQVDWRPEGFDDRLKLTLGARTTKENKDFHKLRIESSGIVSVPYTEVDDSYNDTSPMVAISWDIDETRTVYAKVAKGFKSGAFNHAATTVSAFQQGFDSETLWSYELGLKSRWLDQRLQVNAAAFYSDYDDIQVSNFLPDPNAGAVSIVDNAGKARISGLELELAALLTENLELTVNYGYLDGEYTEYTVFDAAQGVNVDVKDDRVIPFLTEHSSSVALDYNRPIGSIGTLGMRLAWSYIDDQPVYPDNFESTFIEAYDMFSARVALSDIPAGDQGRVSIALWAKNLTDEEYYVHGIDFGAFGFAANQFGDPRTFGVEVTYNY
ncbi:TonB-dependent receptor [Haliea salexigens]|uniref:TonB-dependent receptor n=1 Tax=Haliea salexigens TaxID=287487 RepID=UPI000404389B|nr:TonB-dependent receptor [Haliea salexigens]